MSKNLGNTEELFDWYKTTVIPISMPQNNSVFAKKCQKIFCHALQNVHLSNSPTSQVCKVGSPLAILAANFTLFESILWHERPILRPRGAKMFVPESKAWKMKDFTGIGKQSRNSKSLRPLHSQNYRQVQLKDKNQKTCVFVCNNNDWFTVTRIRHRRLKVSFYNCWQPSDKCLIAICD